MSDEQRERDIERREKDLDRREAALDARLAAARSILEAADERDVEANARDTVADDRDRDADREAFLSEGPGYAEYIEGQPIRRHAAQDRVDAKVDRVHSADDRDRLTEGEPEVESHP